MGAVQIKRRQRERIRISQAKASAIVEVNFRWILELHLEINCNYDTIFIAPVAATPLRFESSAFSRTFSPLNSQQSMPVIM